MLIARFLLPLAVCLGLLALLLMPVADKVISDWMTKDLRLRSQLVASSVDGYLTDALDHQRTERVNQSFSRLAKDEKLIGVAFCSRPGAPQFKNTAFPQEISCDGPETVGETSFEKTEIAGVPVMLARIPFLAGTNTGYIVVVHDMSFLARRSATVNQYAISFIFIVSAIAAFLTILIAKLTMSGWMSSLKKSLQTGKTPRNMIPEGRQLMLEVRQALSKMEREYKSAGVLNIQWSAQTLYEFVRKKLPSEQLISVSYRQPYSHHKEDGKISWSTPASGLVTALEPIMKACRGTWIAVSTGDADRDVVDAQDCVNVPPGNPAYKLKRLWLEKEEENGFYAGFANEGIWPLCNIAYIKPRFRTQDWEHYQSVNRKFADAVIAEALTDRPIVFIQDYHFALLPQYIREKLPNALIICFWHIPWPNSEVFGILPWRREFLSGMLAADIVGFHTRYMCNNFIDCVDSYVESLIDREHHTVTRGNSICAVRPYPISIAWPEAPMEPSIAACREELLGGHKIMPGTKVLLGVERLDYVKGIPERFRAFELLLEKYPAWRGRVVFVQIASPSRSVIPAYANISQEIETQSEKINARFQTKDWRPIHLLKRNFNPEEVYRFYRAADACVVSSLHDGMNLVAKEFVAAREDNQGVLVLSQFAGASKELVDALIINPYDEEGMVASFVKALEMTGNEQQARMKSLREQVEAKNVYAWAGKILGDAAKLYNRRQLEDTIEKLNTASENIEYRQRRRHAEG
jgi:alpha,alpha-trehalose-phosphate synthase [UDP-forming]